jgi:hypothetical protein
MRDRDEAIDRGIVRCRGSFHDAGKAVMQAMREAE